MCGVSVLRTETTVESAGRRTRSRGAEARYRERFARSKCTYSAQEAPRKRPAGFPGRNRKANSKIFTAIQGT